MEFDFGDVLRRAWEITWKRKVLWIIGIVFGLLVSLMFPLMFFPALFPMLMQNSRMDMRSASVFMIGSIFLFFLFIVVLYPISVLTQSSLTLGVLHAEEEGGEALSVMNLIKKSFPFFWRVLGLMVLFAVGMGLINLIIQAILILLTILTLGIAIICMMPLTLLMYPVLYGAMVWMEQSMSAILLDNMTVMEAARQGWNLVRNNLKPMTVMALVVYLGAGLVAGVLMMPMVVPFFILPFGFMENHMNWTLLSIAVLWTVAFIPLFAVVTGVSMIFTKSAWVLTYLRLTRNPNMQPLPGTLEATS